MCHLFDRSARAEIFVYSSAWKTPTWWKTLRSCFLSSLVEFRWAVSEKKSKMSQPIRGKVDHLVFPIGPKNTNLVEDVEILLPVKFSWIPFSCFREEVENVSANQRPGWPSCFSDRPQNTNLVENVKILLPVEFCWIPFSGFRGEVENVSANQRPGRPSCFSNRPEKTQTWKRTLKSCFLSSFGEFRSAVSEEKLKMSQPIRGQGGHLVFPIGPKNTNLVEDVEILLPVKFRWIPFSRFREEVENVKS